MLKFVLLQGKEKEMCGGGLSPQFYVLVFFFSELSNHSILRFFRHPQC